MSKALKKLIKNMADQAKEEKTDIRLNENILYEKMENNIAQELKETKKKVLAMKERTKKLKLLNSKIESYMEKGLSKKSAVKKAKKDLGYESESSESESSESEYEKN